MKSWATVSERTGVVVRGRNLGQRGRVPEATAATVPGRRSQDECIRFNRPKKDVGREILHNYYQATVGFRQSGRGDIYPCHQPDADVWSEWQPLGHEPVRRTRSPSGAGRRKFRPPFSPQLGPAKPLAHNPPFPQSLTPSPSQTSPSRNLQFRISSFISPLLSAPVAFSSPEYRLTPC
jgi:hypothetical protein